VSTGHAHKYVRLGWRGMPGARVKLECLSISKHFKPGLIFTSFNISQTYKGVPER
jgi:hypothetical protein